MAAQVPLGVAAAVVVLFVVMLVPVAHRVPTLPDVLPPLAYDPAAVERGHARDAASPLPAAAPEIDAAWDALAMASATRRPGAMRDTQAHFADILGFVTARVRPVELRLRARARGRFLQGLRDPRAALTIVARRHRLAGPEAGVYATRAVQIAWFDLRWERFALPTPERGPLEPLPDTLLRIPSPERRALASWGLAARCPELLGVDDYPQPGDPERCAEWRQDLVALAAALDRDYPRDEALAATEVFEGLAMRTAAARTEDGTLRSVAEAGGSLALARARDRYADLLAAHRTRRFERHLMAVVSAMLR